jgi:pimeloyl-ACP methyl ester carboxylesterase
LLRAPLGSANTHTHARQRLSHYFFKKFWAGARSMSGGIIGHPAPMFDEVDRDKFREVVPSVETDDLASIIDVLKKDKQLDDAKVFLLGWSEGTMIASLVAEKFPDKVEAILLAGYAHENLYDIIAAQFSGRSFNDQSQSCL